MFVQTDSIYPGALLYLRRSRDYVPVTVRRRHGSEWVVLFNDGGAMYVPEDRLYSRVQDIQPETGYQPLGWYDDYDNAGYDPEWNREPEDPDVWTY